MAEQKGALRAEWSIAELDFQRMDRWMNIAHETMYALKGDWRQAFSAVAALQEFYRIMRPLLKESDQTKFDLKFKGLETKVIPAVKKIQRKVDIQGARGKQLITRLPDETYLAFSMLFNDLYSLRQHANLGIPARATVSNEQRVRDAFGIRDPDQTIKQT